MRKVLVLSCLVLSLALPAGAVAEVTPTLRTERVYFHCNGDTKVANVNYADSDILPGWDTNAPTQSVQDGAGCGWADPSATRSSQAGNSYHDGAWRGEFVGNLESLNVQLHSISAGPGRRDGPQTFNVTLEVNGRSVFGLAEDGRAARAQVRLTPVVSDTQLSSLYEFAITDLPFVTEDGDGSRKHRIVLNVAAASEPLMAWVYDTTEVDSGMVFNPPEDELAEVQVSPLG
jgi:hypothetical protein